MMPDTQGHWALLIMAVLSSCLRRRVPWLGAWGDGYGLGFFFFFPKWFLFLSFFLIFYYKFYSHSKDSAMRIIL